MFSHFKTFVKGTEIIIILTTAKILAILGNLICLLFPVKPKNKNKWEEVNIEFFKYKKGIYLFPVICNI